MEYYTVYTSRNKNERAFLETNKGLPISGAQRVQDNRRPNARERERIEKGKREKEMEVMRNDL